MKNIEHRDPYADDAPECDICGALITRDTLHVDDEDASHFDKRYRLRQEVRFACGLTAHRTRSRSAQHKTETFPDGDYTSEHVGGWGEWKETGTCTNAMRVARGQQP